MSNIRKFQVKHNDYVVSFDIEIDLDARAYWPMENYQVKTEGDSIKSDIIEMSLFWGGSPSNDAPFEDHLKFFSEVLSRKLAHYIINESSIQKYVHQDMNKAEGYISVFGKHINITNIELWDEYVNDGLSVEEIK